MKESINLTLERIKFKNSIINLIQENIVSSVIIKNDLISLILNANPLSEFTEQELDELNENIKKQINNDFPNQRLNIMITSEKENSETVKNKGAKQKIPNVKNVILVLSGKGGVGKSSITVLLAHLARHFGHASAIIDADIYGPSIPKMMGLKGQPILKNNKMLPLTKNGIKTISIGYIVDEEKAAIWRGPMLGKALNNLLIATDWAEGGEVDFLFVDMPPGTGDVALNLMEKYEISGAVLVSTPQKVALADVKKAHEMCQKMKIRIHGLIENMSYFTSDSGIKFNPFGESVLNEFCEKESMEILVKLPFFNVFREMLDEGVVDFDLLLKSDEENVILSLKKSFLDKI